MGDVNDIIKPLKDDFTVLYYAWIKAGCVPGQERLALCEKVLQIRQWRDSVGCALSLLHAERFAELKDVGGAGRGPSDSTVEAQLSGDKRAYRSDILGEDVVYYMLKLRHRAYQNISQYAEDLVGTTTDPLRMWARED